MKMYKTKPMTESRVESLKSLGYYKDTVFEDGQYEPLKKILFDIGGEAVILCYYMDKDEYRKLVDTGRYFHGVGAKIIKGQIRECHENSKALASKQPHYDCYFGFALSDDGAWRYHSWVWNNKGEEVLETTEARLAYYGIKV